MIYFIKNTLKYREKAKHLVASIISPFLPCLQNSSTGPVVRCLINHHVSYEELPLFEEFVKRIQDKWHIINFDELKSILAGGSVCDTRPKILFTFDDSFKSNKIVSETILQKAGVKAIFFVCPNFVELADSPEMKWKFFVADKLFMGKIAEKDISDDMQPMNWDDLKKLIDSGHTIGSHTLNHPQLSSLVSEEALQNEIIQSGDLLEMKLGIKVESFAYPFGNNGSINKRAYDVIKKRYNYCFTCLRGRNVMHSDPYYLLRDHVDIESPVHYNDFILSGGWDWYYKSKITKLLSETRHPFKREEGTITS